jgi:hypothetical protein
LQRAEISNLNHFKVIYVSVQGMSDSIPEYYNDFQKDSRGVCNLEYIWSDIDYIFRDSVNVYCELDKVLNSQRDEE